MSDRSTHIIEVIKKMEENQKREHDWLQEQIQTLEAKYQEQQEKNNQ